MLKQRNTVASTAVPYPEENVKESFFFFFKELVKLRASKKVMQCVAQNGWRIHKLKCRIHSQASSCTQGCELVINEVG